MNDIKSGLNPLSPDNLPVVYDTLTVVIVLGTLFIIVLCTDKYIIPRINPDNRFIKWWKRHIVDINPFVK